MTRRPAALDGLGMPDRRFLDAAGRRACGCRPFAFRLFFTTRMR